MFGSLIPKETGFFDYFEKSSHLTLQAAGVLRDLTAKENVTKEECEAASVKIKSLELEADKVADTCIDKLHATFITPFDRADMHRLMKRLDDVMDYLNGVAHRFVLFHVTVVPDEIRDLAALLYEATQILDETIPLLRNLKNEKQIRDNCAKISKLENCGDDLRRRGLQRLFDDETDAIKLIKSKELLERMECTVDSCEHVANVVAGVVVEAS